jgi:hypothetical protein
MTTPRAILRYGGAFVLTLLAGQSVALARPRPVSFPPAGSGFTFEVRPGATSLRIGVRTESHAATQVTVTIDDRQASFLHRAGSTATYRVALASSTGARRARIDVDPPASVTPIRSTAGLPLRQPALRWEAAGPPLVPAEPRLATSGRPTAEASVDETDTYGLRLFGVPVRSGPRITAPIVASVSHGDRLEATCWAFGDAVTDGFPERPMGAYTSVVWFKVGTPAGPGFIPDVRFSRRGNSDRLNLPACPNP